MASQTHQRASRWSPTFENLDPLVQGNVLVDHLATMKRSQPCNQVPADANQWSIHIQSLPVVGAVDTRIREAIYRPLMIKKWSTLFNINKEQTSLCDWDLFFCSLNEHQTQTHINLIKYLA